MHNPLRIAALRERMRQSDLSALYIRSLSNIAWLSGFERVFDTESAHALILTQDACVLHSDSRYVEALRDRAQGTEIEIDASRVAHAALLCDTIASLSPTETAGSCAVGIEDSLTLSEFRALEKACAERDLASHVTLVELNGFVEQLREVKDPSEIEAMKKAQRITDAAFLRICDFMAVGMTERQVQLQLDQYLFEEGAEGLAFDTIVATGAHAASPHAIPGETLLEKGDAVVMDFGARYAGYCSDMTRTVFMGQPSDELIHAWDALRETNESCEALLHEGVSAASVHDHAEEMLSRAGYAGRMGHSLGHSVGLDIHEAPNLSPSNVEPVRAGNVVTVEPGIYVPGKFGMRLEDFGVITEDGYDVFTKSTHKMVIIKRQL